MVEQVRFGSLGKGSVEASSCSAEISRSHGDPGVRDFHRKSRGEIVTLRQQLLRLLNLLFCFGQFPKRNQATSGEFVGERGVVGLFFSLEDGSDLTRTCQRFLWMPGLQIQPGKRKRILCCSSFFSKLCPDGQSLFVRLLRAGKVALECQ